MTLYRPHVLEANNLRHEHIGWHAIFDARLCRIGFITIDDAFIAVGAYSLGDDIDDDDLAPRFSPEEVVTLLEPVPDPDETIAQARAWERSTDPDQIARATAGGDCDD